MDHNDSPSHTEDDAWPEIEERIIEQQSTKVDVVSEATESYIGIKEAVEDDISKAQ
ncbi:FMN-binding protein [Natranaerobius trueperi]|uniref:FMN-binding protein n=1 Tax=Natranaerobius trueperi TaxID=759412 RepID=UPI003B83341D